MNPIDELHKKVSLSEIVIVAFPHDFFPADGYEWTKSCGVRKEDFPEVSRLTNKLLKVVGQGDYGFDDPPIQKMLASLKKLSILMPFKIRGPLEEWDYAAEHKPDDIGGAFKPHISKFISERVYGRVLEAMCGFNSYLLPHVDRIVTAQDYSEQMLLQYEYPRRQRIKFDINQLPGKRLGFPDETFDAVVFVKGYKYVDSPVAMFEEWSRLLKPGGKLVFVELLFAGYPHLIKREFVPSVCKAELAKAGFSDVSISLLPYVEKDYEELFYVVAVKK